MKELRNKIQDLKCLAYQSHYYNKYDRYTCPKHPKGPINDYDVCEGIVECSCGADNHNKKVEESYRLIEEELNLLEMTR